MLLALAGCALGMVIARAGLQMLIRPYPESLPRIEEVAVDTRVLLVSVAVAMICGLLFGLAPHAAHARGRHREHAEVRRTRVLRLNPPSRAPRARDGRNRLTVIVAGAESLIGSINPRAMSNFFDTMGIPIVQGRGFEPTDAASPGWVTVVNEKLASSQWKGQNPLGQQLRPAGDKDRWFTVIGVAKDIKQTSLDQEVGAEAYVLVDQFVTDTPTTWVGFLGRQRRVEVIGHGKATRQGSQFASLWAWMEGNEPRQWLSGLGDDDLLARAYFLDEPRQMRLRFMDVDAAHRS